MLSNLAQYVAIQAKADPRNDLILMGLQYVLFLVEYQIKISEEAKAAALPNIEPFD